MTKKNTGNEMWGGRFAAGPAAIMEEINASIDVDKRLWREDIDGSHAHARMLAQQAIISTEDLTAIEKGLNTITGEIEAGTFVFSAALEDIHMNIEARLRSWLVSPPDGCIRPARGMIR